MANEAQLQAMQALMQMSGGQRMQLLQEFKKPVGKISESPKNRPSYHVMEDPNYKPFQSQYGAIGVDGKVGGSWRDNPTGPVGRVDEYGNYTAYGPGGKPPVAPPAPAPAPAPVATPKGAQGQSGGGFFDWLSGLMGGGGKAPAQPTGPKINSLTGLPMGTQVGDPAWLDQQVAGAPRVIPVPGPVPVAPQDYSQASQDVLALANQVQQPGGALQSLAEGNQIANTWGGLLTGHGNLPKDYGISPRGFGGLPDTWDPVKLPTPVRPTVRPTAPATPKKGKKGLDYSASDFEKEPGGQALRWLANLIQPRPQ